MLSLNSCPSSISNVIYWARNEKKMHIFLSKQPAILQFQCIIWNCNKGLTKSKLYSYKMAHMYFTYEMWAIYYFYFVRNMNMCERMRKICKASKTFDLVNNSISSSIRSKCKKWNKLRMKLIYTEWEWVFNARFRLH